ncbi:MAG: hypothetical protein ACOY0R_19745 [Chloroflexota bacterium]|jgi:hypothetical protein
MRIRDASGWTIFVFGALAVALGLYGLIRPENLLALLGFEIIERSARAEADFTITFMIASSMASFNMGVYYILAALNNIKAFYRWTVPFRIVTLTVFTAAVVMHLAPTRFLGVAIWEGLGAAATGLALRLDRLIQRK